MSYDKLIEEPKLTFDRQRVRRGGDALADYMEQLIAELEEKLRDVNRYANHFRGFTHASDFDKIDGGDHYAGSILTAAVGTEQITHVESAFTQAYTQIGNVLTIEQTLPYSALGGAIILLWGASISYDTAPAKVPIYLYRSTSILQQLGPITTVNGDYPTLFGHFTEAPAAGNLTYTLRAQTTAPGAVAEIGNISIVAVEYKR